MTIINTCLTLRDLPPAPVGKTGWLWSEPQEPTTQLNGHNLPKISIVTPSYNQGQFLEETIRSVLLQGYPNLEYIIIDGGSQDNSIEVIKKYEKFLTYWISEPDQGQANAINKGIEHCSGHIFAWLNSDDLFTPNTLNTVATIFQQSQFDLLCGKCEMVDANGEFLLSLKCTENLNLLTVLSEHSIAQPSCFINANLIKEHGFLAEDLHYSFDYDYWIKLILAGATILPTHHLFSQYRVHDTSKTQLARLKFDQEMVIVHQKALQQSSGFQVRKAIAKCYRRFANEHYFWYSDRATSMYYFHKMLQINPFACDLLALKVYLNNLLNRTAR